MKLDKKLVDYAATNKIFFTYLDNFLEYIGGEYDNNYLVSLSVIDLKHPIAFLTITIEYVGNVVQDQWDEDDPTFKTIVHDMWGIYSLISEMHKNHKLGKCVSDGSVYPVHPTTRIMLPIEVNMTELKLPTPH